MENNNQGQPAKPGSSGTMTGKMVCVCVYVVLKPVGTRQIRSYFVASNSLFSMIKSSTAELTPTSNSH